MFETRTEQDIISRDSVRSNTFTPLRGFSILFIFFGTLIFRKFRLLIVSYSIIRVMQCYSFVIVCRYGEIYYFTVIFSSNKK